MFAAEDPRMFADRVVNAHKARYANNNDWT